MSAPSRKRGVSALWDDHSPRNSKKAKTAAASTRSAATPPATTMIVGTKDVRSHNPPETSATLAKTPTTLSSPSPSPPSSPSPSSSSASASSDEDASSTSALDPAIPPSPSPSSSSCSSSSDSSTSSPSSAVNPTPSPTRTHPPRRTHLSTLPTSQKPPLVPLASAASLRSRLSSFLPALAAANQDLEIERAEGRLAERDIENLGSEDGEGGKAYIEMDLGLGVLEERRDGSESGEEGESESEVEARGDVGGGGKGREKDVLGRLLGRGRRRRKERPGIEVVNAT